MQRSSINEHEIRCDFSLSIETFYRSLILCNTVIVPFRSFLSQFTKVTLLSFFRAVISSPSPKSYHSTLTAGFCYAYESSLSGTTRSTPRAGDFNDLKVIFSVVVMEFLVTCTLSNFQWFFLSWDCTAKTSIFSMNSHQEVSLLTNFELEMCFVSPFSRTAKAFLAFFLYLYKGVWRRMRRRRWCHVNRGVKITSRLPFWSFDQLSVSLLAFHACASFFMWIMGFPPGYQSFMSFCVVVGPKNCL